MKKAIFENIELEISSDILRSNLRVDLAVAWFTNQRLFDIICKKLMENTEVSVLTINDPINFKEGGLDWQNFIELGGKLYISNIERLMHHKFCIIDNNILYNGSYNWTYSAEFSNIENIIRFESEPEIISSFQNEFDSLLKDKDGVKDLNVYSLLEFEEWYKHNEREVFKELKYELKENLKIRDEYVEKIKSLLERFNIQFEEKLDTDQKNKTGDVQNGKTGFCKKCSKVKEYFDKPLCLKCYRACPRCGKPKYEKHDLCYSCYKSCPKCWNPKYEGHDLCYDCYKKR